MLDRLQAVTIPTVESIGGYCVGGGWASPARSTSVSRHSERNSENFGHSRTIALLLTAELMSAEEARLAGFPVALVDDLKKQPKQSPNASSRTRR